MGGVKCLASLQYQLVHISHEGLIRVLLREVWLHSSEGGLCGCGIKRAELKTPDLQLGEEGMTVFPKGLEIERVRPVLVASSKGSLYGCHGYRNNHTHQHMFTICTHILTISSTTSCVKYCSQVVEKGSSMGMACKDVAYTACTLTL